MNKTITLITGAIVAIALTVFLALGEIDLQTYGTFTATSLGVIYGFYKKIETDETKIELVKTEKLLKTSEEDRKYALDGNLVLSNKLSHLIMETQNTKEVPVDLVLKTKTNKKPKV